MLEKKNVNQICQIELCSNNFQHSWDAWGHGRSPFNASFAISLACHCEMHPFGIGSLFNLPTLQKKSWFHTFFQSQVAKKSWTDTKENTKVYTGLHPSALGRLCWGKVLVPANRIETFPWCCNTVCGLQKWLQLAHKFWQTVILNDSKHII